MKMKKVLAAIITSALIACACLSASAQSIPFSGQTSGGTWGTTTIKGLIKDGTSAAYEGGAGLTPKDISLTITTFDVIGHLYVSQGPSGSRIVDTSMGYGGGHALGEICKYGAPNMPANGQSGYRYSRAVMEVNFSSPQYGSWAGSQQLTY